MSKFKIGDKVIVREGVNEFYYKEGAIGRIVKFIFEAGLKVEFYEGPYRKVKDFSTWALPSYCVKSLEKGKARPPKKPITSITKKYKFKYENMITGERLNIYKAHTFKGIEEILIDLRNKGFKWETGTINKNEFSKYYKKYFGELEPVYIFAFNNGIVKWRHMKDGTWIYKRI